MLREAQAMQLRILGMNGPFPAALGATSGYLLTAGKTAIALDMGSGVLSRLTSYTAPESLTALVLSHWHADHACDVLPLIYRLESTGQTLHIYAPIDKSSPIRQAVLNCRQIILHDISAGDTINLGDVTAEVFSARHPVPAVMLRFTHQNHSLFYTGDTNTVDHLIGACRHADLLLADGLFTEELWAPQKPHLSARLCAETAQAADVARLVITHLNPTIDPTTLLRQARAIRPDAVLAREGDVYTL